jgi:hypothetical protein
MATGIFQGDGSQGSVHMAFKFNQDFIEKIVILSLTAVLTGLMAPYVLKQVDEAKSVQQKILEADLARQAKIIEAQSKLLDDMTETLWKWRYLSMKVAYYGMGDRGPSYATALKDYDLQIWDVLSSLRFQITKSRRLASEDGYKVLVALYDRIVDIDAQLTGTASGSPSPAQAEEFQKLNKLLRWEMTEQLDEVVDLLAKELRLKRENLPGNR